MANDNNIQLDLEISDRSIDSTWRLVDERGQKSAKSSAIAFEVEFGKQEEIIKAAIRKLTNESKDYVAKSARESAVVFQEAFTKQNNIYKASVKQNLDNALSALTSGTGIKKSAAESASVFEEAFKDQVSGIAPIDLPINANSGFKAVQSLADVNAAISIVKLGLDTLKKAFSETLDIIFEGERIQKTESRFKALATQVGIVSESFNVDLKKSLNGFVDDTDALKFASEAFVRLGKSAERLPQVIEASRKVYQVFGGEILDTSGKIISAAETGNKRVLKDIGLYTDLEGAVKKYAKSIGTVPALLTDTQKEQARLNAILAEADTRFAGVQVKAGAISSYTQLKTAIKDLNDEFAKIANSKLGGIFKGLADAAKAAVESISNGLTQIRGAESVKEISNNIDSLRVKQAKYQADLAKFGGANNGYTANLRGQLIMIKDQISSYEELRRKLNALAATQLQSANKKGGEDTSVDEVRVQRRQEAANKVNEINKALAQSEIQLAQDEFTRNANRANLESIYYQQRAAAAFQYEAQKAELEKFFAENGAADEATQREAREALELTHVNNLLKIRGDYRNKVKTLTNEGSADITSAADGINAALQGASDAMKFQTTSMKASLKDLGKAFVTTFKQQATNAIFQFAQGSKNAEEAAQGLFTGILNGMGEMLISQGLGFILQGAAFTFAGMPNGAALAGAGAAMVAAGAAMAAISAANGGKTGASASGGGSAGGNAYTNNNNNDISQPIVDTKPENPNTTVNLNIDKVFDRKETGMWITDILTENFEQNGIVIRGKV